MRYRKTRIDADSAERILDRALAARREAPDGLPTPLAFVRTRVEARLADSRKETLMARTLHTLGAHPRLSFGVAVELAFILFGALVPLPYSSVIGYSVRITAPADINLAPQAYADALHAAGIANPSVNVTIDDAAAKYTIAGLSSESDARAAARTYTEPTGADPDYAVIPIVQRTSGTLYAQAIQRLFRVEVAADGKSDEEIAAEIAAQIAAQGGEVKQVTINRGPDGRIDISIDIDTQ